MRNRGQNGAGVPGRLALVQKAISSGIPQWITRSGGQHFFMGAKRPRREGLFSEIRRGSNLSATQFGLHVLESGDNEIGLRPRELFA